MYIFLLLFFQFSESYWNQLGGDYRNSHSVSYSSTSKIGWVEELQLSMTGLHEVLPQVINDKGLLSFFGYQQEPFKSFWYVMDMEDFQFVSSMVIPKEFDDIQGGIWQDQKDEVFLMTQIDTNKSSMVFSVENNQKIGAFEHVFNEEYIMGLLAIVVEKNDNDMGLENGELKEVVVVGTSPNSGLGNTKIYGIDAHSSEVVWKVDVSLGDSFEFYQLPFMVDSENSIYIMNFTIKSSNDGYEYQPFLLKINGMNGEIEGKSDMVFEYQKYDFFGFAKPVYSEKFKTVILHEDSFENQITYIFDASNLKLRKKIVYGKEFTVCSIPVVDISESIAFLACGNTPKSTMGFVFYDIEKGEILHKTKMVDMSFENSGSVVPSTKYKGRFYVQVAMADGIHDLVFEDGKMINGKKTEAYEGISLIDQTECLYSSFSGPKPTFLWNVEKLCFD